MTSRTGREATWMQKRNLLGSSAWLLTRDTSSELLTHISRTRDSVILLGIWEVEIQVMFDLLCNFQWAVVEKGGCTVSGDRWRPPVHLWRSIAYSYIRLVIQINRSKRDKNCSYGDFEWQISDFRAFLTPTPPPIQKQDNPESFTAPQNVRWMLWSFPLPTDKASPYILSPPDKYIQGNSIFSHFRSWSSMWVWKRKGEGQPSIAPLVQSLASSCRLLIGVRGRKFLLSFCLTYNFLHLAGKCWRASEYWRSTVGRRTLLEASLFSPSPLPRLCSLLATSIGEDQNWPKTRCKS